MGLSLIVYAKLNCTAIDKKGKEIKSYLIEHLDCWNFTSNKVEEILNSENKIDKYKEILQYDCDHYDHDFDYYIKKLNYFIEEYKDWEIIFEAI